MTARAWCFTLNNPPDGPLDVGQLKHLRYAIWQKEVGESGTPHWQGYIEFSSPVRRSALGRLGHGIHSEPRRGTRDQARDYCRKGETRSPDPDAGPHELGEWDTKQGARTDLERATSILRAGGRLRDIADVDPVVLVKFGRGLERLQQLWRPRVRRSNLKVYVLWGRTGTGKTKYVHDMWEDDLYTLASQRPVWFDGYAGERVLLIDEIQNFTEGIPREFLLRILDVYPLMVPVKGGMVAAEWEKVYITSNSDPTLFWDEALKRRVTSVEELV